jgi:hypothetical protein
MKNKIGLWAFFIGMVLALITAFVDLGGWVTQVLIVLGMVAGALHQKIRDELLTLGVIYLALSVATDSVRDLIGFGAIISSVVAAWVRFLGPVVLTAFMMWGAAFLMVNRSKTR